MKNHTINISDTSWRDFFLISGLVNDVVRGIFQHFVATDWDGPFTLILVCTAWRDMVLSTPTLWTWIMMDSSSPDWNERMVVAAHLSRSLPLHVVLRAPFASNTSISHIICRCTTLFVELDREPLSIHPPPGAIVPFEEFIEDKAALKEINDSIMVFLKDVPTEKITILSGEENRACFAYSAWTVYEHIIEGSSFDLVLNQNPPFLVTSLVFKATNSVPSYSPPVKMSGIWELLPSLPHLSNLQLGADFIEMDSDIDLPRICLPSLLSLFIDSSTARNQLNSDFLDLVALLEAPIIHSILLRGDWRRLMRPIATLLGELTPEELRLSFSVFSFSDLSSAAYFDGDKREICWGLNRLTFEFPCPVRFGADDSDPENSESRSDNSSPDDSDYDYYGGERQNSDPESSGSDNSVPGGLILMPKALIKAMRPFLHYLPKGCSIELCGGDELDPIVRSAIPHTVYLAVFYSPGMFISDGQERPALPRMIDSLTLGAGSRLTPIQVEWLCSAENVNI